MDDYDYNNSFNEDQRQFDSNWAWGSLFNGLFPGSQQGGYPSQPPSPWPGGYPGGPTGFPGGNFPNQPGPGFPGQSGGNYVSGPPSSPPPSITPHPPLAQTKAVDPGAIQGCLYRNTYVWLRRSSFWFFPVYIGRESAAGYRWDGRQWFYYGIDLDRIRSFQCY